MKYKYIYAEVPFKHPGASKYDKAEIIGLGVNISEDEDVDECYLKLRQKCLDTASKSFSKPIESTIEVEEIKSQPLDKQIPQGHFDDNEDASELPF